MGIIEKLLKSIGIEAKGWHHIQPTLTLPNTMLTNINISSCIFYCSFPVSFTTLHTLLAEVILRNLQL